LFSKGSYLFQGGKAGRTTHKERSLLSERRPVEGKERKFFAWKVVFDRFGAKDSKKKETQTQGGERGAVPKGLPFRGGID